MGATAAVLIIIASAAAPQAAHQFDLTCTLTDLSERRGGGLPEKISIVEDVKTHLRIDLKAKRWCEGDCLWRAGLEASYDEISLQHLDEGADLRWTDVINRATGSRTTVFMSGESSTERGILEVSKCVPSAFSGFPLRKF